MANYQAFASDESWFGKHHARGHFPLQRVPRVAEGAKDWCGVALRWGRAWPHRPLSGLAPCWPSSGVPHDHEVEELLKDPGGK